MAQRTGVNKFQDIPNIGPAMRETLLSLGFASPADLIGCDPYKMYEDFCMISGKRQDPCVLDVFIAAVRYMEGAPSRKWWFYTAERKRHFQKRD